MNEAQRLRILAEFEEEGREDWIGLWRVARAVEETGVVSLDAVRRESLGLVRTLLDQGKVSLGHPNLDRSFTAWQLPAEQAISRLDLEWRQLGRNPNIGEIAWINFEK